ncbi:MAG: hypothetical protein COA47_02335 [Robiginitomaculum sp.]|nr:MAG: hypothetical protein COA47_02335 [Robiginitomaculum sp.]
MLATRPEKQNRVRQICKEHNAKPSALIEILHQVQDETGFLPKDALVDIADALNISRADIYGVVTFYHDFRQAPLAGIDLKICRAEACQAVGSQNLAEHAKANNHPFTDAYCLGNCALGPAVMIDKKLYGRVDADRLDQLLKQKGE